jgi:hypothetical protein
MSQYGFHFHSTVRLPQEMRSARDATRMEFMTDEEMDMINEYITILNLNQGQLTSIYERWRKEEEAYKGDQPLRRNRPNTRVNIVNANIEGQVSALVEQNLAISTRGESIGDKPFAEWARIGLDWTFRKNKMRRVIEQHERRRLKHGSAWFKVHFDPMAIYGFGLARISNPSMGDIFIDGKVKDPLCTQDAEYIAEKIDMSYSQMCETYGDDKANACMYGTVPVWDEYVFEEFESEDDNTSTTIFQYWSKPYGILRLQEFSADGVLLYDSHKKGTRKDNQRDMDYKNVPYYSYVDNKYPYFFTYLYPEEGQIYGFGDGKLLLPLQDMINDLYDKIRIAARPHLILIDPESELDIDEFDENSFEPIPCKQPTRAVHTVAWGTVNESWWRLLASIHTEVQRVTRFSELMTGQGGGAQTATEASIQQQQGNAATNQKKLMLEQSLIDVAAYALGLMMEFYTEEKAFRLTEKKDEYAWIDFRKMREVPVQRPASAAYTEEYLAAGRRQGEIRTAPQWELLTDSEGNTVTKNVELDIEITIGAGLPKNKAFLWQMITQLAPLAVEGKPLMTWLEFRKFIIDFLGVPLMTEEELRLKEEFEQQQQMLIQQQQAAMAAQQGGAPGQPGQPPQPGINNEQQVAEGGAPMAGGSPAQSMAAGAPQPGQMQPSGGFGITGR